MYPHVTPFLKSINSSLSNCSLRDGSINFIKYASRILLLRVFPGALVSTHQLNSCAMFLAKCFAGSGVRITISLQQSFWFQLLIFFFSHLEIRINFKTSLELTWFSINNAITNEPSSSISQPSTKQGSEIPSSYFVIQSQQQP